MSAILLSLSVWFFGYGLWEHDWKILVASALVAVIWPLIADGVVDERSHRELLDKLWDDDDDLSRSA